MQILDTRTNLDYSYVEKMPEGFRYTSDKNEQWLTLNKLRELVRECK